MRTYPISPKIYTSGCSLITRSSCSAMFVQIYEANVRFFAASGWRLLFAIVVLTIIQYRCTVQFPASPVNNFYRRPTASYYSRRAFRPLSPDTHVHYAGPQKGPQLPFGINCQIKDEENECIVFRK